MNYHIEHHLYPRFPFHALPELKDPSASSCLRRSTDVRRRQCRYLEGDIAAAKPNRNSIFAGELSEPMSEWISVPGRRKHARGNHAGISALGKRLIIYKTGSGYFATGPPLYASGRGLDARFTSMKTSSNVRSIGPVQCMHRRRTKRSGKRPVKTYPVRTEAARFSSRSESRRFFQPVDSPTCRRPAIRRCAWRTTRSSAVE